MTVIAMWTNATMSDTNTASIQRRPVMTSVTKTIAAAVMRMMRWRSVLWVNLVCAWKIRASAVGISVCSTVTLSSVVTAQVTCAAVQVSSSTHV